MSDVLKAIYVQQSKARRRRDWKAVQHWERVEFAIKDALFEFYGNDMFPDEEISN